MAPFIPFQPSVKGGVAGFTQVIVLATASGNLLTQFNNPTGSAVLIQTYNANAAGTTPIVSYVRLSVEASTAIIATSADTPIVTAPQTSAVHLFATPAEGGPFMIAVTVTVSPTVAGSFMWITPGQGGAGY